MLCLTKCVSSSERNRRRENHLSLSALASPERLGTDFWAHSVLRIERRSDTIVSAAVLTRALAGFMISSAFYLNF